MSNCDFGSPCDCRECRTQNRIETCPKCSFGNVVELVGTAAFGYDRKGMRVVDMTFPDGPPMDLACRKCGFIIPAVAFHTGVDEAACKAKLEIERIEMTATPCAACGKRSKGFLPPEPLPLTEYRGRKRCADCLSKAVEANTPDPSTATEKYEFRRRSMKWELVKVKQPCESCGRLRWLKVENRWQKRCSTCYRNSVKQ